ncbi:precorrin-2 dehydrogenase/sirohydrochlorin ferrochelatase family protein [Alkalicoccus urumqiensis]|nr:bifunctional precorrin-2 dehydrogenase/sirohydrochlorin ferrochelatase [Alkalicoccus urumqiensis]
MTLFPVQLQLEGRRVIIIGGGAVALRRFHLVKNCGADVTIVSPSFLPELEEAASDCTLIHRRLQAEDVENAFLLILAAPDEEAAVIAYGSSALVNDAVDASRGDLHIPQQLTHGRLQITISTGGAGPAYTKKLKEQIEQLLPSGIEAHIDYLYELRQHMKQSPLPEDLRREILREAALLPETEGARASFTVYVNRMLTDAGGDKL